MRGKTERDREHRQSKTQQDFRRVLRDVARDDFVQERQARDTEVKLHRDLAEELVDLGYRALTSFPIQRMARLQPHFQKRQRNKYEH
jgi:hypothetical protein